MSVGKPEKIARDADVRDTLKRMVEAGMSTTDIARSMGVSTMTIYRAGDKLGVPMRRGRLFARKSIRDAVQDMKPMEAVEYLIEAYEVLSGECATREDEVATLYKLSPFNAKIFTILESHLGEPVRMEFIAVVMSQQRLSTQPILDWDARIRVAISQTRRKLKDAGAPFVIKLAGTGVYIMHRQDQDPDGA